MIDQHQFTRFGNEPSRWKKIPARRRAMNEKSSAAGVRLITEQTRASYEPLSGGPALAVNRQTEKTSRALLLPFGPCANAVETWDRLRTARRWRRS